MLLEICIVISNSCSNIFMNEKDASTILRIMKLGNFTSVVSLHYLRPLRTIVSKIKNREMHSNCITLEYIFCLIFIRKTLQKLK